MTEPLTRSWRTIVLAPMLVIASVSAASAVMLVELKLDATARPYGPNDPVSQISQEFSVPPGPGTVTITYTEENYVGGPGGFSYEPKDLSNEYLGWGGSAEYRPRDPAQGQRYQVIITLRRDFSKKVWVARLLARHEYQAYQVRNQGRQRASIQSMYIEFVPGGPDGAGAKPATTSTAPQGASTSAGGAAPAAPLPAAPPPATPTAAPTAAPTAPPPAVPTAAPAAAPQPIPPPPASPTSPPSTPPAAPPAVSPPAQPTGLPGGSDSFDSTSKIVGDPFDGGVWSNARNGSAAASRTLPSPVCIAGVHVESAGSDVDTTGSVIEIALTAPSGARLVALQLLDSAIARSFSPGGRAHAVVPPQTRLFAPFSTRRIDVTMRGHGWFLVSGLRFMVVPCP